MARKAQFVVNRAALDEVTGGFADGVADIVGAMVEAIKTRAPDAPPYGEGLLDQGAAIVWTGTKKTHQIRSDGGSGSVRKPPGVPVKATTVTGVVGWGFPASLVEFGTIKNRARPFFTPGVNDVVPDAEVILSKAMKARLRGERSPNSAAIRARIAAAQGRRRP